MFLKKMEHGLTRAAEFFLIAITVALLFIFLFANGKTPSRRCVSTLK